MPTFYQNKQHNGSSRARRNSMPVQMVQRMLKNSTVLKKSASFHSNTTKSIRRVFKRSASVGHNADESPQTPTLLPPRRTTRSHSIIEAVNELKSKCQTSLAKHCKKSDTSNSEEQMNEFYEMPEFVPTTPEISTRTLEEMGELVVIDVVSLSVKSHSMPSCGGAYINLTFQGKTRQTPVALAAATASNNCSSKRAVYNSRFVFWSEQATSNNEIVSLQVMRSNPLLKLAGTNVSTGQYAAWNLTTKTNFTEDTTRSLTNANGETDTLRVRVASRRIPISSPAQLLATQNLMASNRPVNDTFDLKSFGNVVPELWYDLPNEREVPKTSTKTCHNMVSSTFTSGIQKLKSQISCC